MVRKPSLRVQWILSLSIAAVVIVVLVIVVDNGNQSANNPAGPLNRKVVVEENREARILVAQDQAPHVAVLAAGRAPTAAVVGAVRAYMAAQIAHGFIVGPIDRVTCRSDRGSTRARLVFGCTVEAADVDYPFDAVAVPGAHQLTYCKSDPPPVQSMTVPVSARCT